MEEENIKYITISQVAKFIAYSVQNNISPYFWSSPGMGKSEEIRRIAEILGYHLEDIRLSYYEAVDMRGLPTKGYMDFNIDENGNIINEINTVSKQAIVEWAMPDFLVRARKARIEEGKPTLFFFDEIGHADPDRQSPAYQFILEKRIGNFIFHEDDRTCAAGNFEDDLAISNPLTTALANRFGHYFIKPSASDWCKWGLENNVYPELLAYIERNPDKIYEKDFTDRYESSRNKAFTTPRSLFFASEDCKTILGDRSFLDKVYQRFNSNTIKNKKMLSFIDDVKSSTDEEKLYELSIALQGKLGAPVAEDLMAYIRVGRLLPSPADICSGKITRFDPNNVDTASVTVNTSNQSLDIDVQFLLSNQCCVYLVNEYNTLVKILEDKGFDCVPSKLDELSDYDDVKSQSDFDEALVLVEKFFKKYEHFCSFAKNNMSDEMNISFIIIKLIREKGIILDEDFVDEDVFEYVFSLVEANASSSITDF